MTVLIGLDIGGTKIAGGAYNENGDELGQIVLPVPQDYGALLKSCADIVTGLEQRHGLAASTGACSPYTDGKASANMPCMIGHDLPRDLAQALGRPVAFGNDANCAALAEARHGAGKSYRAVFGMIIGTGVGGGFVLDGKLWAGPNHMAGEIGHIPLPYYEESDGEKVACGCGQTGCLEKLVAGSGLARLYQAMTGKQAEARVIGELAQAGDTHALRVLDRYYTVVAKAMVVVLHTSDPEIITVSGGLNALPGLYDEVPKRWGRYAISKHPRTLLVPAQFGAMAGMRGAAWLNQ